MKATIAIAFLFLASTAHAAPGQCPASRPYDPCKMAWSEKYGMCVVANYHQCTGEKSQQFSLSHMAPTLAELERRYKLPRKLLWSTAMVESRGNPKAKGKAGEIGLFQFMPSTAKQLKINPHDPDEAAEGAAKLYSKYFHDYGNLHLATVAWNCGPACVLQNREPPTTRKYRRDRDWLMASRD